MRWIKALGSELFEWLLIAVVIGLVLLAFAYAEWTLPLAVAALFIYGVISKVKKE